MPALSPDTVVVRRDDPLTARVDDDLVMLDPAPKPVLRAR
jgi:hypothetical protein